MSASFALSARPTSSAVCWVDAESLVVEIPSHDGSPPYITRYPKTTTGLKQALNVLLENPSPKVPATCLTSRPLPKMAKVPNEARQAASDIVKKMFK